MTNESYWHPDLLRRFVAAPFIFTRDDGSSSISISSNDLGIALGVHRSGIVHSFAKQGERLSCKVIRDMSAPLDGSEISFVSGGTLRVLFFGRGTILIHDHERSELLGFLSCNVTAEKLISSLIPSLLAF